MVQQTEKHFSPSEDLLSVPANNSGLLIAAAHHRLDQLAREAYEDALYGSVSVCIRFENGVAKSVERITKGNER